RALAAASPQRIGALPDVPTIGEAGYKDIEADFWNALFAPAKTPNERLSELAGWFTAALQTDIKVTLLAQGQIPVGCVVLVSGLTCASNTKNTAVSFARPTSKPSELPLADISQSSVRGNVKYGQNAKNSR